LAGSASSSFSASCAAGGEQREGEVELQGVVVRRGFDRLAQAHDFGVRIDRRRGHRRGGVRAGVRRGRLDAVVFQEFAQLAFGQRAGKPVHQLPVLHQDHGGHRADLERARELLLLVHVHLGQFEGAVVLGRELLEDRAQRLARAAPGRPEVDQHRHLQRALDDLSLEAVRGGVEDVRPGGVGGHGGIRVRVPGKWRRGRGNATSARGM
jgi:hypothetical protein